MSALHFASALKSSIRRPAQAELKAITLSVVFAFALSACSDSKTPAPQQAGLRVSVLTMSLSTHAESLTLNGQIVAREQIRISTQMDGLRIVRVLADQGQRVEKDAVLVELDSATMDAEFAQAQQQRLSSNAALIQASAQRTQAQSALTLALADQQRFESVLQQGAVSTQDVEARRNAAQQGRDQLALAAANVKAAAAQQNIAESNLALAVQQRERLKIRAPVAGTLSDRQAEVGSIASMSDAPLFMLMPDGAREFEADLDLNQLARLPEGAEASVEIAQLAQPFRGHLRVRALSVRGSDRRGPVRFALVDADQLPIGASASANVVLSPQSSISLAPSAVLFDPEPWVYVVGKDSRVQRRALKLSANGTGDQLMVLSGLNAGEQVVESAATLLSPGALIRAVKPEPVLVDLKLPATMPEKSP